MLDHVMNVLDVDIFNCYKIRLDFFNNVKPTAVKR